MSILDYHRPKTKVRLLNGEHVNWIENNTSASYIRRCVLSYPPWACRVELQKLWDLCRQKESETGIAHVLAHVIPLRHHRVCGLTVPENIKVITWLENLKEGNYWSDQPAPEQFGLFGAPEVEQYELQLSVPR